MRTIPVFLFALALAVAAAPNALALPKVTWHWAPSPTIEPDGRIPSIPVGYEVFVLIDDQPAQLVATVRDTLWSLKPQRGSTYRLQVRAIDAEGERSTMSEPSAPWTAPGTAAVPDARRMYLGAAVPNPFNPVTTIAYDVPQEVRGDVSLRVLDLRGRLVCDLEVDPAPGSHRARWDGRARDGRAVAAGVYLVQYRCGAVSSMMKVTLLE